MTVFFHRGARAEQIASKHRDFLTFVLSVLKVKKTPVFTIHFMRLVEKTSQKQCFLRMRFKSVSSIVWTIFVLDTAKTS